MVKASYGLMDAVEMERRIDGGASPLDIAIDKWQRAGDIHNWPTLKGEKGAHTYLREDTCALCSHHKEYFEKGPKRGSHCLGRNGWGPCPLVEKSTGNLLGCTEKSIWQEASAAAECGDRVRFMKARDKLLRKLRDAARWY